MSEEVYVDNFLNGESRYYKDSKLHKVVFYCDGLKDQSVKYYYDIKEYNSKLEGEHIVAKDYYNKRNYEHKKKFSEATGIGGISFFIW